MHWYILGSVSASLTAKWDGVSEMQLRILQEQQNLSREPAGFGEYE